MRRFGTRLIRSVLASSAPVALIAGFAAPAWAQTTPDPAGVEGADAPAGAQSDIIVTGSRIKRSATDTAVPVAVIDSQVLTDRGFTSAAQALNTEPSINQQLAQSPGTGAEVGSGIQAPSLFGLGTGRTLTLVNGRRMVTTSSGLGDAQVDANIIPTGLLSRIEVVEGGGAAVYGSDAIAGVVNYILRQDFEGIEADVQAGVTGRGDYSTYSARLTAGTNFAEGRGNIAANVEWSHTDELAFESRPITRLSRSTVANPADTGPNDGIASLREVLDARFWEFNQGGVIFTIPAPAPPFLTGRQFLADGSVGPYNPGTILGVPFAAGGQGYRLSALSGSLRPELDRLAANVIGHYDLSDNVTLSTELLYARTRSRSVDQYHSNTVLGSGATGTGAIAFTNSNPYLTPAAIAQLSAASPSFAFGAPLFLSKLWTDIFPDNSHRYKIDTYRGVLALDGHFAVGTRTFDWSLSGSYARVDGVDQNYGVNVARFNNAIAATRNPAGQIVCAINADASPANDDAACAPINPFGVGVVSPEASNYVSALTGSRYRNEQYDLLASVSGAFLTLPAGDAKFALTYEHRDEKVAFTPLAADQAGVFGVAPVVPQSGRYNTDEASVELLVPLVGGDFTLPLIHSLELSGVYRYVDNSVAGTENIWNVGARWEPTPGIIFRASRSRNFRAPSLTQLFAPSATSLAGGNLDPCDFDRIASGSNPTQRRASCLALFQTNPTFGTGGPGGAAPGSSAEARLAAFQNSGENFTTTLVTTGGNPDLRNEISKTWTYGVVLQPHFIPGLTITADRIEINLTDGLSAFTTQNFAEACYDDPNPAPGACEAFTRMTGATGASQAGSFATGTTTTFNAGVIKYRGETYRATYEVPLADIFDGDPGRLELDLAATHTSLLTSSITGTVFTRSDNTTNSPITSTPQPKWAGRFDVRYSTGPFRFTYEAFYLSSALRVPNATVENDPFPRVASNLTHSISFQFDLDRFNFRFGVNNLTDKAPSYPTINYGDIIGRQFYAGARVKF